MPFAKIYVCTMIVFETLPITVDGCPLSTTPSGSHDDFSEGVCAKEVSLMVTYNELFQFGLLIIALVTLVVTVTKDKS